MILLVRTLNKIRVLDRLRKDGLHHEWTEYDSSWEFVTSQLPGRSKLAVGLAGASCGAFLRCTCLTVGYRVHHCLLSQQPNKSELSAKSRKLKLPLKALSSSVSRKGTAMLLKVTDRFPWEMTNREVGMDWIHKFDASIVNAAEAFLSPLILSYLAHPILPVEP